MASVVPFPELPSEVRDVGPDTLSERMGELLRCDTDEFLSSGSRAKLFARSFTGWCYYLPDRKTWCIWDETAHRWRHGDQEITVLPLMEQFLTRMLEVAEDRRIAIVTGETGLLSNKALYDLLRRVKHHQELHRPSNEWDTNPYLLGVSNGVVDLRDGRLYTGCRGAHVSIYTEVPYFQRRIHSDCWDKLLLDITKEDRELRLFLRDWFGSMLTGNNPRERFTLLYGPGGTGKSTIVSAVLSALGPYAMVISSSTLAKTPGGGGSAREDLAEMQGRRIVICPELSKGAHLDPTLIKTLTGQDAIRARGLYERGRQIRPTWSLVAASNVWPQLAETPDSGWWRRILTVPFIHRPRYPDPVLKERLSTDQEQQSILSWLIAGSVAYHRYWSKLRTWTPPDAVRRALGRYRLQYDHIGYWMEACVRRGFDDNTVSNVEVAESYHAWCDYYDLWPDDRATPTHLGRALADDGYQRCKVWRHGGSSRGWRGIRLVEAGAPTEMDLQDGLLLDGDSFEV